MPALQLDPSQWESLLRVVSDWLPNSLVVYHWLKILSTEMAPPLDGAACYVDQWPNPTRVCCIDPVIYDGLPRSYFLSFALKEENETVFLDFLQSLDFQLRLSSLSSAICGLSLPINLAKSLCSYFRDRDCAVKYYENEAYWVPPELHPQLLHARIELPDDYYFDTLLVEESEFVDQAWPHRWIGSLPLTVRKIRYMPNVCVRRRDHELASFEIMHSEFGLINHLYTRPQFRRQGLAKCVELRQMQKALLTGMIPYKLVVCENKAPAGLTGQIGLWKKYGDYPYVEIFTNQSGKLIP